MICEVQGMFKVNDVVFYGTTGICKIIGIEDKVISGTSKEYFVLKPEDGRNATIYLPTGNQSLLEKMRRLLTKKEVNALIDSLPNIEPNWIKNDNERKVAYGKILASGDHTALIKMLKALYRHKKEREVNKKPLGMTDDRLMKAAEQLLYDEWQYVLGMGKEDLISYISKRIEPLSNNQTVPTTNKRTKALHF